MMINNKLNKLNKLLGFLATDRSKVQSQKDVIADLQAKLEETELYIGIAAANEMLAHYKDSEASIDKELRKLALEIFAKEGEKTICEEVKIGEYTVVTIDDEPAARAWASIHNQESLKLDKMAIKKVAKVMPVDGISISTEHKVKVARDLSVHLPTPIKEGENG